MQRKQPLPIPWPRTQEVPKLPRGDGKERNTLSGRVQRKQWWRQLQVFLRKGTLVQGDVFIKVNSNVQIKQINVCGSFLGAPL